MTKSDIPENLIQKEKMSTLLQTQKEIELPENKKRKAR